MWRTPKIVVVFDVISYKSNLTSLTKMKIILSIYVYVYLHTKIDREVREPNKKQPKTKVFGLVLSKDRTQVIEAEQLILLKQSWSLSSPYTFTLCICFIFFSFCTLPTCSNQRSKSLLIFTPTPLSSLLDTLFLTSTNIKEWNIMNDTIIINIKALVCWAI